MPITISKKTLPSWLEQQKIVADDGYVSNLFGFSTDLDSSGTVLVVGSHNENAAYIFTEFNGTWIQQQKITGSDTVAGDVFGYSVSISGDGKTIVVGAYADNSNTGAAYIFTESGGTWTEQQKIIADDATSGTLFAGAVAISGDGSTILAGTPWADGHEGVTYSFIQSGSPLQWTQQQRMVLSNGSPNDVSGNPLAINYAGTVALICAQGSDIETNDAGAVYIYTRPNTTSSWTEQQILTPSDPEYAGYFGFSIATNPAGDLAVIGAHGADKAYVFSESGGTWSEQQILTGSETVSYDYFGYAVGLDPVNNTIIVGSILEIAGSYESGVAYVFTESDGTWTEAQKLVAFDPVSNAHFGKSVTMGDSIAFIAAPNGGIEGSVYYYTF